MVYQAVELDFHESIYVYHLHACAIKVRVSTHNCNVQLLDGCIVRVSGQTSLIIGYVKNANDFRPRPSDKCSPKIIARPSGELRSRIKSPLFA